MTANSLPLRLLLVTLAGWVNLHQQLTQDGEAWLQENVQTDAQWWGDLSATCVASPSDAPCAS
jgi:hypothetical protein